MKNIKLVRVDFRLIHGQVITKWKNIIAANQIIIVDDQLAKDTFLSDIYVMAAPPDVSVHVLPAEAFITKARQGQFDDGTSNILVLFKSIDKIRSIVEQDITFSDVQIGGLGGGENRKSVISGIAISANDLLDLKFMQSKHINVHFQVTPEEPKVGLDKAISKFEG